LPVPLNAIRLIQIECFRVNDPQRWLIAIISDTGMRLSEVAGLLTEDIKLDADVPHNTSETPLAVIENGF
jgi:integrase